MSSHKSSFTWVVHAVITSSRKDGGSLKVSFEACIALVAEPKIPTAILLKGKNLKAVVELVQLGISHRLAEQVQYGQFGQFPYQNFNARRYK